VSVGLEHSIEKDDRVITAYRCHPFAVMRGGTIKAVLGEVFGRQGGSMHIFTSTFFGGNGIVTAQVPLALVFLLLRNIVVRSIVPLH